MRRGEPRTETSERVVLRSQTRQLDGWALNSSRGGVRAILEERVELGDLFDVRCGSDVWHPGRVVWLQDEPDGVVVGVAYLDVPRTSTVPPPGIPT
jgi:PilZ domain